MLKDTKVTILYVDDDNCLLENFKSMFKSNYEIITTNNPEVALEILNKQEVQIIISDQKMPHMTGVELFNQIKDTHPNPIKIILTGIANIDIIINANQSKIIDYYIRKPFKVKKLETILSNASKHYHLTKSL